MDAVLVRSADSPAPGPGRVLALLRAAHLAPSLAVTAIAGLLAAGAGAGPGRSLLVASVFLVGQLSVGWSNDWLDASRDAANRRTDKPAATGEIGVRSVRRAAWWAAAATVPLSFTLGPAAAVVHLFFTASAWAYNLGLKATAWSFLPYAVSFGALPSVVGLALPAKDVAPLWATGAGALLGVGAHLTNVLPDLADDLATGVRGMPHRMGARGSLLVACAALAVASLLVVLGPPGSPGAMGWIGLGVVATLVVVAVTARSTRTASVPFYATIGIAVMDVLALVLSGSSLVAH